MPVLVSVSSDLESSRSDEIAAILSQSVADKSAECEERVVCGMLLAGIGSASAQQSFRESLDSGNQWLTYFLAKVLTYRMDAQRNGQAVNPKTNPAFWEVFLFDISKNLGFDKEYVNRFEKKLSDDSDNAPDYGLYKNCFGSLVRDPQVRALVIAALRKSTGSQADAYIITLLSKAETPEQDLLPALREIALNSGQAARTRQRAIEQLENSGDDQDFLLLRTVVRQELGASQPQLWVLDAAIRAFSGQKPEWLYSPEGLELLDRFSRLIPGREGYELLASNLTTRLAAMEDWGNAQSFLFGLARGEGDARLVPFAIVSLGCHAISDQIFEARWRYLLDLVPAMANDNMLTLLQTLRRLGDTGGDTRRLQFVVKHGEVLSNRLTDRLKSSPELSNDPRIATELSNLQALLGRK